jgi:glutamyl-Q tRNA(Asp) synthetase
MEDFVTRFAPSPNGYLHLGHAFSALTAYRAAQAAGGRFLLRIEDIDLGRARPVFEQAIYEDLSWLGLEWALPVRRQSEHFDDYEAAITRLTDRGLTYPCFCTRKEIAAGADMASVGPEGPVYPGICKHLTESQRATRFDNGDPSALRLDMAKALQMVAEPLSWVEEGEGMVAADPASLGDIVLARKDIPTSYHVSVVVDDALQGVTHVIRGRDLYYATPVHRLLQMLLGLPQPTYHHHRLIEDDAGIRLAKSKGSPALKDLRAAGESPQAVMAALGLE